MDDIVKDESRVASKSKELKGKVLDVMPFKPKDPSPVKGAVPFLVQDKKYGGQYVAMPSFNDRTVVAFGSNRTEVRHIAKEQGYEHPVIVHVSETE